jgi:hypothetical protein
VAAILQSFPKCELTGIVLSIGRLASDRAIGRMITFGGRSQTVTSGPSAAR